MLWALVMLGLLPTAFLFEKAGDTEADDVDERAESEEDGRAPGAMLDLAGPDPEAPEPDATEPGTPLLPDDPDIPDLAGPTGNAGDPVLSIDDPEQPDLAGPPGAPEDQPITPDLPEYDGPLPQIGLSAQAAGPAATSQAMSPEDEPELVEEFWVSSDPEAGCALARISDFVVGQDTLCVSFDAQPGDLDFDWSVEPTADGLSSALMVNGEVIALFEGAPDVTAADVIIQAAGGLS